MTKNILMQSKKQVNFLLHINSEDYLLLYWPYTSAVKAFGPGYFRYSASVLEPRHIGVRPKDTPFWPRLSPEAIKSLFCLGYGMNRGHIANLEREFEVRIAQFLATTFRFECN